MFNPWHDIELGENFPAEVPALIEVPRDSKVKYELDKDTGLIRVDRILYSAVHYPANYGLIPRTFCDDGDPLDILVLCQESVVPLCLMNARPIGVLKMIDKGELDDKIIAVHIDDPEFNQYQSIDEIPKHRLKEIKQFFEDYKILENKKVVVEKFGSKEDAIEIINEAKALYDKEFGNR